MKLDITFIPYLKREENAGVDEERLRWRVLAEAQKKQHEKKGSEIQRKMDPHIWYLRWDHTVKAIGKLGSNVIIAVSGDEVLGAVSYDEVQRPHGGTEMKCFSLQKFGTIYPGRSLGENLINELCKKAAKRDCGLHVVFHADEKRLNKVYSDYGFKCVKDGRPHDMMGYLMTSEEVKSKVGRV